MTVEPRSVLITGGAGYIGAVSANALIAAGHRVVILDDLSAGHADTIPNEASSVVGSYADGDRMQSLLRDARIDTILHIGALSIVAESVAQPERYFKANLVGSIALLDAAIAVGVKRLIFALLHDRGRFMLSRNFRLQAVGGIEWLFDNYDFATVSHGLDELMVVDVTRGERDAAAFAQVVGQIAKGVVGNLKALGAADLGLPP